ncbi:MAG: hypothetical protein NVS3B5_08320 [Sphingomicrobium sp.]
MEWLSLARFMVQELAGRPSEPDDDYYFDEPEETAQTSEPMGLIPRSMAGLGINGQAMGSGALEYNDADRVYRAFDASQPVNDPAALRGRESQLSALLAGVLLRRNHGIIAGPRGSGKTSLVRSFGQSIDRDGIIVLYAACDDGTNFGDLMREYLQQIPDSSLDSENVLDFRERVRTLTADATPNQVTSLLSQITYSQVIIICDEFDRVTQADLQWKTSSLLKLLSDARIPVRFMLVGDGSAFETIIRGHSSLSRHITLVRTDPLDKSAMLDLLNDCAMRCGLTFSPEGLRLIQDVACGSPYHARLFGLHAAIQALCGYNGTIGVAEVLDGLSSAFDEWAKLNVPASDAILAIASGFHGDPATFVGIARSVIEATGDFGDGAQVSLTPAQQIALAPALEPIKGAVRFRDPIAPQFLIAKCAFVVANATSVKKGRTSA